MKSDNKNVKKHFVTINELEMGNYFGEIAALSSLRRTSSVVAVSSMVIGKMKIDAFQRFVTSNSNFQKRIRKKITQYKDYNIKMIFNMIRTSSLFG